MRGSRERAASQSQSQTLTPKDSRPLTKEKSPCGGGRTVFSTNSAGQLDTHMHTVTLNPCPSSPRTEAGLRQTIN